MRSKTIGLLLLLGLVMPLGACNLIGGGGEGTEENQGAENNQSEDEENQGAENNQSEDEENQGAENNQSEDEEDD